MGRCKDCRWWARWKEELYGECSQPKQITGYIWGPKDVPIDGLVVESDEGWEWYSGEQFGCVNFEEKLDNSANPMEVKNETKKFNQSDCGNAVCGYPMR